ncbi:zinc finger CCHC domain-containing protein 2 [Engraulis encrasicolus]|uniref:zinc finger CCHC domain-containing protein 2 n=1 Tax=Engraulis encrasicolus TaxID=184585 RepID=UPI002FD3B283
MLEMKLPMRAAEEEGDNSVEEEQQENGDCNFHTHRFISKSVPCTNNNIEDSVGPRPACPPLPQLNREAVFEWFGLHLSAPKRIEFMCGLLHMCQPFELRFLGSCLEELARKDFHVLRDCEIKANSPSDLGLLMDVSDPLIESKLLVCLSLLGSENRECAEILYRTLRHVHASLALKNCGGSPPPKVGDPTKHDGAPSSATTNGGIECGKTGPTTSEMESGVNNRNGSLDQLALLFAMASLHPAFPFHQKETIKLQLNNVESAIAQSTRNGDIHHIEAQTDDFHKSTTYLDKYGKRNRMRSSPSSTEHSEGVHIEKIILKEFLASSREYSLEVLWSNQSSSTVTKSHLELETFFSKLSEGRCSSSCEKALLRVLSQSDQLDPIDQERMLKEKLLLLPLEVRQMWPVCSFFLSDSSLPYCFQSGSSTAGSPCQSATHCSAYSETSSLEEAFSDMDLKPYGRSVAWMKHSSKGGGRGRGQSSRRRGRSEHSRDTNYIPRGAADTEVCRVCGAQSEQCCVCEGYDEKYGGLVGKTARGRAVDGDRRYTAEPSRSRASLRKGTSTHRPPRPLSYVYCREKVRSGEVDGRFMGSVHCRSSVAQKKRQDDGPDAYGETSSESSYSTTSSPQHLLHHASLQSEDEDDREDYHDDGDSKSDTDGQDTGTLRARPAKGINGQMNPTTTPLPPALEKHSTITQDTTSSKGNPNSTEPSAVVHLPSATPSSSSSSLSSAEERFSSATSATSANDATLSALPSTTGTAAPGQSSGSGSGLGLGSGQSSGSGFSPALGSGSLSSLQPTPSPPLSSSSLSLASSVASHPSPSLPPSLPLPLGVPTRAPSTVPPAPSPALTHSTAHSDATASTSATATTSHLNCSVGFANYVPKLPGNSSSGSGSGSSSSAPATPTAGMPPTPIGMGMGMGMGMGSVTPPTAMPQPQSQQQQQQSNMQQQQQQQQGNMQQQCAACGCGGGCSNNSGGGGMSGPGVGGGGVGGGGMSGPGVGGGVSGVSGGVGGGGHQVTTGYFLPPQPQLTARQMYSAPPPPLSFLHMPPLRGNSYPPNAGVPPQAHQNSPAHSTAVVAGKPPTVGAQHQHQHQHQAARPFYLHMGVPHSAPPPHPGYPATRPLQLHHSAHSEHLLAAQSAGYGLAQIPAFNRFFAPIFSSVAMMPGGGAPGPLSSAPGGGGVKKAANVSCYNCGMSGHYAQECKQTAADGGQPGGFRLKYLPTQFSEALDKID